MQLYILKFSSQRNTARDIPRISVWYVCFVTLASRQAIAAGNWWWLVLILILIYVSKLQTTNKLSSDISPYLTRGTRYYVEIAGILDSFHTSLKQAQDTIPLSISLCFIVLFI